MTGIHITSIVSPEQGWLIAMHCPICKETTFVLSLWAVKPKDGNYWRMSQLCASDLHQWNHNMRMAMESIDKIPFGKYPVEVTEPHWSPSRVLEFQPHDPPPMPYMSSWVDFEQEMPIEEAKRRWPNTPIGQPQPEQTQTVHSAPNESDTDSGKSME